ncbi:bifunctional UDP-N-acetylmuramoyl-tripeptide:D-alanyl-D-alanine ligase/alanine racemase [Ichthyobacterium seriolicida]|uniref:Alanine racemase n=1 Tax=Ichthyobacterium seriolicida TaxID=242600 RepID=A0A1J1E2E5_9FLAO|nr:bifunctional UDP-N-acetylmuramoyl-tripeptide:D-alanyl-D-alanine ligase/alanine racemase [Ichthyobacterium seriolicida]BAV95125.1 alanine racemase [Ichthyobacterium seriolicida]
MIQEVYSDTIHYDIDIISKIICAQSHIGSDKKEINKITTDSRQWDNDSTSLFFALNTQNDDGHNYIKSAYNQGVRNFVVEKLDCKIPNANFLLVKDVLTSLQNLAVFHREKFNIPIIGITGSGGKTTVKEWLYQILKERFNTVISPNSYNSQTGVPLSIWEIKHNHKLGVFEAGISNIGEMEKLEKIISPTIGIFTNIGDKHSENFTCIEQKIHEKLKLFKNSKTVIVPFDDKLILNEILKSNIKRESLLTWGYNKGADLQILKLNKLKNSSNVFLNFRGSNYKIILPFKDDFSIENAIQVLLTSLYLGIDLNYLKEKFAQLSISKMRLEQFRAKQNCIVINDNYTLDFHSFKIALNKLNNFPKKKKTLIISDIHIQGNQKVVYENIFSLIDSCSLHRIFTIGKNIDKYTHLFNGSIMNFKNTKSFLEWVKDDSFSDEVILLKGDRSFNLKKISKVLEDKKHNTILEINLSSLVQNLDLYRSFLKKETKVMAMVKAFSYGSGSYEIAQALQFHRIDYLAVAYVDEGISLRNNGITTPILVLNPEYNSYKALIEHDLEPEIYTFDAWKKIAQIIRRHSNKAPYPIHLKLDTGMHRLGFESKDINKICEYINDYKELKIKSVFSHLAESDKLNSDFTEKQINLFKDLSDRIQKVVKYPIIKHILNSSGIINYPSAHFDMVRLGIGLYGVSNELDIRNKSSNVFNLNTVISQIKNIKKNETIGYNRSFLAKKNIRIATLPIGYADGINTHLSNGKGYVIINNKKAEIVGRICMDMMMVDISDIQCYQGDSVEIFGQNISISEIAEKLNTISYEVLTSISTRVKRVYVYD